VAKYCRRKKDKNSPFFDTTMIMLGLPKYYASTLPEVNLYSLYQNYVQLPRDLDDETPLYFGKCLELTSWTSHPPANAGLCKVAQKDTSGVGALKDQFASCVHSRALPSGGCPDARDSEGVSTAFTNLDQDWTSNAHALKDLVQAGIEAVYSKNYYTMASLENSNHAECRKEVVQDAGCLAHACSALGLLDDFQPLKEEGKSWDTIFLAGLAGYQFASPSPKWFEIFSAGVHPATRNYVGDPGTGYVPNRNRGEVLEAWLLYFRNFRQQTRFPEGLAELKVGEHVEAWLDAYQSWSESDKKEPLKFPFSNLAAPLKHMDSMFTRLIGAEEPFTTNPDALTARRNVLRCLLLTDWVPGKMCPGGNSGPCL